MTKRLRPAPTARQLQLAVALAAVAGLCVAWVAWRLWDSDSGGEYRQQIAARLAWVRNWRGR